MTGRADSQRGRQEIVHRYGVTGEVLPQDGAFRLRDPFWDESFANHGEFLETYGLEPICFWDDRGVAHVVVGIDAPGQLKSDILTLSGPLVVSRKLVQPVIRVRFRVSGVRHHLLNLVSEYARAARECSSRLPHFPLRPPQRDLGTLPMFQPFCSRWVDLNPNTLVDRLPSTEQQQGLFHEINGFLWTAKALVDSFPALLNLRPSVVSHGTKLKRSFKELYSGINSGKRPLPTQLRARVESAWHDWACELKHYRDCMDHFAPLGPQGWPFSDCLRSEDSVLAVRQTLPDNPEEKSTKKFRFDRHVDALQYAHRTYTELIKLTEFLISDTADELADLEEGDQMQDVPTM